MGKGILIILDGLGDRPQPVLDGLTPLEAASTPNLDHLTSLGACGLVDPLFPGLPVGTQTGSAALMGLSPRDLHRVTRGPVEAAGVGLPLLPGDVALRANFATLRREGESLEVLNRWAGRIRSGTVELAEALSSIDVGDEIDLTVRCATQHRAVVRLSGPALSARITDTDPGDSNPVQRVRPCSAFDEDDGSAVRTARAVNRLVARSFEILSEHPVNRERVERGQLAANGMITRSAGQVSRLVSLPRHYGVRTAVVAAECTILGLGRLFGYATIHQPSFTSLADTDLDGKVAAAREALEAHDLVFLHVKAPDICSHDREPAAKSVVLGRVDAALAPLLEEPGLSIAVTGDHSTDSALGCHSGEPVPALLRRPGGRVDAVTSFGERQCMNGGLGRIPALGLLLSLLDAMGAVPSYRPYDRSVFGFG